VLEELSPVQRLDSNGKSKYYQDLLEFSKTETAKLLSEELLHWVGVNRHKAFDAFLRAKSRDEVVRLADQFLTLLGMNQAGNYFVSLIEAESIAASLEFLKSEIQEENDDNNRDIEEKGENI
jgi:hypothetical protein